MAKPGRPRRTSTSTVTRRACRPSIVNVCARASMSRLLSPLVGLMRKLGSAWDGTLDRGSASPHMCGDARMRPLLGSCMHDPNSRKRSPAALRVDVHKRPCELLSLGNSYRPSG